MQRCGNASWPVPFGVITVSATYREMLKINVWLRKPYVNEEIHYNQSES